LGDDADAARASFAQLAVTPPDGFKQFTHWRFINMRFAVPAAVLLVALSAGCSGSPTSASEPPEPNLNWGPAPAVFPAGAQMAVLQGDPSGTALFTVRLRFPDGYKIQPHTHPTDENVTVVSGTFVVGMGSAFDESAATTLGAGGFVTAPANHAHFAAAHGVTTVQVHAMGPFAMTYVNPADTPK
jgi:quercetin dioxygenase-like cupin family protein